MHFKKILLFVCFITTILYSLSSATPPNPKWIYMPDSIKAINNVAELESLLTSDHPVFKRWGVERLGQIGTSEDIPRLLEVYTNEPFEPFGIVDRFKDVKDEALMAIGKIGGQEAENALFSIFDQLDVYNIKLPDSLDIVRYLCIAFGKMSSSNAIERLDTIYHKTNLSRGIRQDALKSINLIELTQVKYSTAPDTVDYMLKKLTEDL